MAIKLICHARNFWRWKYIYD